MPYVNIDGSYIDSETGALMREVRTYFVESMPQAKELALNEFSEEANIWIYDDESGRARMPLLSVWHRELQRWEDTRTNIYHFFARKNK